jgi:hypothetical protein
MDDHLEAARRMGREGQQAMGLSVQEQGEYDKGRRERDQMLNGGFTNQGGGGGGGIAILFMLALIAPAFAAPGLALWALWNHFQTTQGWDWPVLTAICVGAGIAMLVVAKQLWDRTPAVVIALVLSLYLGVSYGLCMPMIFSTDVWWTSMIAVATAAAGYWAGLNAPNRWLSSFITTTIAALALGVFLNLFALEIVFPTGAPLVVAMALKWAGAGLALGAVLRLASRFKFGVLGVIALIAAGLFFAPGLLGDIANSVLAPPEPTYIEIES